MTDTAPRTPETPPPGVGWVPFGTGAALRRYWWIPVLLAAIGVAVGYVVGNRASVDYTATSRLTIADVDVETRSVPGFVEAAQTLTSSYSRVVLDGQVINEVARQTGLSPAMVLDRVSSSPIPESTIFTVQTTGLTSASAVRLNEAVTDRLIDVVRDFDTTDRQTAEVYDRFRRATRQAASESDRIGALRARRRLTPGSVKSSTILAAEERRAAAQLRADAAGSQYQQLVAGTPSEAARQISVLSRPRTALDDRTTLEQRSAVVGLVVGLAVGLALMVLLGRRRWNRLLRASLVSAR